MNILKRKKELPLSKREQRILFNNIKTVEKLLSIVDGWKFNQGEARMVLRELKQDYCIPNGFEDQMILASKYGVRESISGLFLALCITGIKEGVFDLEKLDKHLNAKDKKQQ